MDNAELLLFGIIILIVMGLILVFLPLILVHILVVDNDVNGFLSWFPVYYWITRIIDLVAGAFLLTLFTVKLFSGLFSMDELITGIGKFWLAVWVYPPYYNIVVELATGKMREPLSLAVLKLVLIITIMITLDLTTVHIMKNKEHGGEE